MKIKKSEIGEKIYTLGYASVLLAFLLQISNAPNQYVFLYKAMRFLRMVGYGCCVIKIICDNKLSVKHLMSIIVAATLSIIAMITSGIITLLTDIVFIIAGRNVNFNKIVKLDLEIRVIYLAITLFLYFTGIVSDVLDYRSGVLSRHSLGFLHPNRLALHVFMICLYYFYLNYNRIKIKHIVFFVAAAIFTLFSSDGRTSVIGIGIITLLSTIKYIQKRRNKSLYLYFEDHLKGVSTSILVITVLFSIGAPVLYTLGVYKVRFNSTFGSRILLSSRGLINYGINLFGQKIELVTSIASRVMKKEANGIDNTYVYMLVNFGVLAFALIIILLYRAIQYSIETKNIAGTVSLLIIIIIGIMENQILNIESNLFLLFVGLSWSSRIELTPNLNKVKNKYEFTKI